MDKLEASQTFANGPKASLSIELASGADGPTALTPLTNAQSRIRSTGASCAAAPAKKSKRKKPLMGLKLASMAPLKLSAAVIKSHIKGCPDCLDLAAEMAMPVELREENKQIAASLSSDDTFTRLVALEKALSNLDSMAPDDLEYATLFTHVATALDTLDGVDILFDRMEIPDVPKGTMPTRCCYLTNIPILHKEIQDNLTMSPKHAFERCERVHLTQYGTLSNRSIAKIIVSDTLVNSKCNNEIDGLGEMELPTAFQALWKIIPADLQVEIKDVYLRRGEVFGAASGMSFIFVEKEIARIMGVAGK